MRTEYTIRIIHENGKVSDLVYPKKYADTIAADYKHRLTDCIVKYYKVMYNGNSFYKAEEIF